MNKDETILEIMKDYPTQKIGLDDFYGRQTVINMMNKAINYTHSCTELICDNCDGAGGKNFTKGFLQCPKCKGSGKN